MCATLTHSTFCDKTRHAEALDEFPGASCRSTEKSAPVGERDVTGFVMDTKEGPRVAITDLVSSQLFDLFLTVEDASRLAGLLTALVAAANA